jgi:asparagine synthase (glutamine-hydrolysing)
MCGICGIVSVKTETDVRTVWEMVELGVHRGPDGSKVSFATEHGFENLSTSNGNPITSWCSLGHSRLTILDLTSASDQPFISADKRYSLVYNGEIYNYLELKNELESLGVEFSTEGDTEVLFQSLILWGHEAIHRLRGMFAFVFIDSQEKSVLLARDRYGIKPLHYFVDSGVLYFASEIKQFTKLECWNPIVNEEVALQFLLYGVTDHRAETFFKHVHRLLPGHYIEFGDSSKGKVEQVQWAKKKANHRGKTYSDAVDAYRNDFEDSIRVHLRSDVPVGSCLSGGLDSSAIVGVASSILPIQSVQTFTATSEQESIDESKYVNAVVQLNNCQAHFVRPTAERLFEDLEKLVWHQDEPFGGTSIFAQWCVFSSIKSAGVKVVLDGQGADEQLAGYNSFLLTYLTSLIRRGKFFSLYRNYRQISAAGRVNFSAIAKFFIYQTFSFAFVSKIAKTLGIASQNGFNWINPGIIERNQIKDPFRQNGKVPRTISDLSSQMTRTSNLPMLLRFEDRNSMAHGVESRVPFVDYKLFDLVEDFPDEFFIDGTYTKKILRDSLSDYLPDEVRTRTDKIGFQTAEEIWLMSNQPKFKQLVSDAVHECPQFFSERTLEICSEIISGRRAFSNLPWRVISFGLWAKTFKVKGC